MSELEKKLVDALRPFTFLVFNKDGSPCSDPWTASKTKMTEALICDSDVMTAREVVAEFDAAEHTESGDNYYFGEVKE